MTQTISPPRARAEAFCSQAGIRKPVLLAPMAGVCPPALSIAVARAGGLGACGALTMTPEAMEDWAGALRNAQVEAFQINLWVPDPAPERNPAHEAAVRAFLQPWNPDVTPEAGDAVPLDFDAQCEALLSIRPPIVSTIMGLFSPAFVERLKAAGMQWFATATTVSEAVAAEKAGADAILAQGMEAGGHRGAFEGADAEANLVGLFALLPAIADRVKLPVVATGGIADARGIAAALTLGASAVQIGTGFMRCPEAELPPAWADALARADPEATRATRAFSGRLGRSLQTAYVDAAAAPEAPAPAPYPVQRGLTRAMAMRAARENDLDRMQAWAGQSAGLAEARPAGALLSDLWDGAQALLP